MAKRTEFNEFKFFFFNFVSVNWVKVNLSELDWYIILIPVLCCLYKIQLTLDQQGVG